MHTAPFTDHVWYTAAACAEALGARKCGTHWRAKCPVHGGDNPSSLKIWETLDKYGHPCTVLHCFAQGCDKQAICAALGIAVRNLFSVYHSYAPETTPFLRTHSRRLAQLKHTDRFPRGGVLQTLLEVEIADDPTFILKNVGARAALWDLAQSDPDIHARFTEALRNAQLDPQRFWAVLARDMGETADGRAND